MSSDAFDCSDHLFHGISCAGAEIHRRWFAFGQIFKAKHMRLSKICHVNVVANASSVGGGIVIAKNVQRCAIALGRLKDHGNEVGLRIVELADSSALIGSGRIEISEANETQAIGTTISFQRVLEG